LNGDKKTRVGNGVVEKTGKQRKAKLKIPPRSKGNTNGWGPTRRGTRKGDKKNGGIKHKRAIRGNRPPQKDKGAN